MTLTMQTVFHGLLALTVGAVAAGYGRVVLVAVIVGTIINCTAFRRKFVNGPYRVRTTGCDLEQIRGKLTCLADLTAAYEPVFKAAGMGTLQAADDGSVKLHNKFKPNTAVFHDFAWSTENEFAYSVDWYFMGTDGVMTFTCTCTASIASVSGAGDDTKALNWTRMVAYEQLSQLLMPLCAMSKMQGALHDAELQALAIASDCRVEQ